jgi:hypothetical protein
MEHKFPSTGRERMLPNARRIVRKDEEPKAIPLVIEGITQPGMPPT